MSLFKSREWWTVNLNENEMYDSQCLITVTLENDQFESILLGNHEGVLRLYSPQSEIVDEGLLGYKPSDLLLEVQLPSPILQINEGILVSGSPEKYVAVLHPRRFSVYSIKKKESKETNVGDQMVIELGYQHVLRHSAHSFVLGPFGGVRGRTFICIQSLDGLVSFYEQESFAFQLYLPNFLLPFPFSYLEVTDSFLFLNSLLIVECYSYEALASAGSSNGKKITKTWEYNLGEGILDINTIKKDVFIIIILSERNLFGLNENGKMIFMKRLEYKPLAMCSFVVEETKNLMIVIASDGGFLNLYEDTNLKWSMRIDHPPVALKRIFLNGLPGGITLLSEDGILQVVYIGTHPSVYLVPPLVQPELDIPKADLELKSLQQKIADNDVVDPLTADLVDVDLKIDKTPKIENDMRKCNVMLEINAQCLVSKVQVLFAVEAPLTVTNSSIMIANCCEKTFVESSVYLNGSGVVSSLTLQAIVTYITSEGVARSIHKNGVLPLSLVVVETTAVKEADYKITITTNKPVCGVNQLFREFATEENSSNALGLKFTNNEETVTILAAKSSQRYRLQAGSLVHVPLLLLALVERLKIHFRKEPDFTLAYSTSLPLDVYFEKIDHHHGLIKKMKTQENLLSQQTSQYRTVQKKILTNLKDVTPKPASNLYKILKDTSQMINQSIGELENLENELFLSRSCISALSRLLIILLELMAIGEEDLKVLRHVFSPYIHDTDEQGWLEVQEATAAFLLRTVLAKSFKDQNKPTAIALEPIEDTTRLFKNFSSVIDRVTKGTHLMERNEFKSKKEPLVTLQAAYESDESFFDEVIPATSKLLLLETSKKETKISVPKIKNESPDKITSPEKKEETLITTQTDNAPEKQKESPEVQRSESDDDAIWDVEVEEMRI